MRQGSAHRLLLAVAFVTVACDAPLHGIEMEPPSAAPPLVLTRATGERFELAKRTGERTLIYFGYTHCPDVCPTTLSDWARVKRALGGDTATVRFVFVSVDPGRDTPVIAQAYAAQFDSGFVGLATTDADVARLVRDWGIVAYPLGDPRTNDYGVAHPTRTYAVDAKGRLRVLYGPDVDVAALAQDLRRLR